MSSHHVPFPSHRRNEASRRGDVNLQAFLTLTPEEGEWSNHSRLITREEEPTALNGQKKKSIHLFVPEIKSCSKVVSNLALYSRNTCFESWFRPDILTQFRFSRKTVESTLKMATTDSINIFYSSSSHHLTLCNPSISY
jgi:hypothetical protein